MDDAWAVGEAYERYMGRWSRAVAARFVPWLEVAGGRSWLDVGCGTGALTAAVLATARPRDVTGVDASSGFIDSARSLIIDSRVRFESGDVGSLPFPEGRFDVVVSGLVLNFAPKPAAAVAEMARVSRPDGVVAGYVWDYAEGMAILRHFWDAATVVDPAAGRLDEGARFAVCRPDLLAQLWTGAGLTEVAVDGIEVSTLFAGFEDFWAPFLGGQGPAPGYLMSLTEVQRTQIRERVRAGLPVQPDGSIALTARAWAVHGRTA